MNTKQITFPPAPGWATREAWDNEGAPYYEGADIAEDAQISISFERWDHLDTEARAIVQGGVGMCVEILPLRGSGGYQMDIDEGDEDYGDPAQFARRLAKELLAAADALEATRQ